MSHPVDHDSQQSGVGDDDLIQGGRGGVTVKEGLQVGLEQCTHFGQPLQEADGQLLRLYVQLAGSFSIHRGAEAQRDGDLLPQVESHILHQHSQGVVHEIHLIAGVAEIAGEEQPLQLADQADDDLPVRLGKGLDAVDVAALLIIGQQHVGQSSDGCINGAEVVGHDRNLLAGGYSHFITSLR